MKPFELEPTPPPPDKGPAPRIRIGPGGRILEERPKKKSNAIWIVLLANAIPAACVVYWFTMPPEKRQEIADKIPSGVGGRAAIAGIAFVVLIVLARVVLPAARAAAQSLARGLAWFRTQTGAKRAALYVPEFFVYLGWVGVQILFALDAVAILACGFAFLGYVARIIKPELLPWLPPQ